MKRKRVIFCGGRSYSDYFTIKERLRILCEDDGPILVIEGGQRGADRLARRAAKELHQPCATVDAYWDVFGNKAGPIRNKWMMGLQPEQIEAFPSPDSIGTWDMVRLGKAHAIPTTVHEPEKGGTSVLMKAPPVDFSARGANT